MVAASIAQASQRADSRGPYSANGENSPHPAGPSISAPSRTVMPRNRVGIGMAKARTEASSAGSSSLTPAVAGPGPPGVAGPRIPPGGVAGAARRGATGGSSPGRARHARSLIGPGSRAGPRGVTGLARRSLAALRSRPTAPPIAARWAVLSPDRARSLSAGPRTGPRGVTGLDRVTAPGRSRPRRAHRPRRSSAAVPAADGARPGPALRVTGLTGRSPAASRCRPTRRPSPAKALPPPAAGAP